MFTMFAGAQHMQAELTKAQDEATSEIVRTSAGGGMVTVNANGAGDVDSVDRPARDRP